MTNYISFRPQDAVLPTYIRFVVTKKAFASIDSNAQAALMRLSRLSQSQVLLVVKGKKDDQIEVFTAEGSYLCVPSDEGLLIVSYRENSFKKQNYVMKFGVCFQISKGIIVQLKLREYEYFFDIINGKRCADNAGITENVSRSVQLISERAAQSDERAMRKQEAPEEEEEEYQPEKRLANLLQVAESYSILSSQLEEQNAQMLGNVAYCGIDSVEYDRVDRVAYQFGVTDLNEDVFKTGVQVEVEDKEQVRHAAEIIELVKEDSDQPATAIKLLFNEQISIDRFHNSGWFNLSFSTVNKDVQLAANEKIRTGEAPAKYMDDVFGKSAPRGFDKKDLSGVKARLQAKKYPPNNSQMDAICSGINTKDVFLVMGPPGTGKTTVILEWVKYFVTQEHKRVLVSSQNNKAVDNVLARIAEEPDIDIIRIGSEAKLQSEVVPFMFENKVAALRHSIAEDSEEKKKAICDLIDRWRDFVRQLGRLRPLKEKLELHHQQLADEVNRDLAPLYRQLLLTLSAFREHNRQKERLFKTLERLGRRLRRHEDATNAIIRFLTGLFYQFRLAKMQRLIPQWEEMLEQDGEIAVKYSRERAEYAQVYRRILTTTYRAYRGEELTYEETFKQLTTKPERTQEDIWDLFAASRNCPLNTPNDCEAQAKQVEQDILRAEQLQQILSVWKSDMEAKQNYALNEIVLESVDLVGATCVGINSQKRFTNLDFDVTIIDEAGQIQVHNALVPMSVSNKLIMLGDHKQIPPTADQALVELCELNDVDPGLLEMSLFEKMYNDLPNANKIMLDTQYRMPAEIADTISQWFYDGAYYSPPFKRNLSSLIPKLSDKPYVVIDTSGERNRFETKIEGAGSSNMLEANIIAQIIQHLASDPENNLKEIGVISAYKSQVKLIKNKVSRFVPKALANEMVATLDSYQGQERDIILYSFTKSSDSSPYRRRIGFLNELRRLNVAMTRCKKMLILIGDMEFLGGCRHCDKDEFGEEIYQKSEREFSDFINKMLDDVRGGSGELMTYRQFADKWKGGDR